MHYVFHLVWHISESVKVQLLCTIYSSLYMHLIRYVSKIHTLQVDLWCCDLSFPGATTKYKTK